MPKDQDDPSAPDELLDELPDAPPDDSGFSFEVVDLTEDESALAEELAVAAVPVAGPKGIVHGRLKDAVTGEPLIGAQIEALQTRFATKTSADGSFTLELPPGIYEVRLRYDTSQPLRVVGIVVEAGGRVAVNRELLPLQGAGETVRVEAEMNPQSEGARLEKRKQAVSANDALSRDEITKSGGGSTSAVAGRIVGATVVGGRFLFVRGLGHRYGNTLFDGARVPSPEPELRTVPLDIFPSAALSAINVQKTFTPDVPGDFTGGSTQLESREVPEAFLFEIGADIGVNTTTSFRPMVTHGGFAQDAFGFGNLPRALPTVVPTKTPVRRNAFDAQGQRVFTDDQIEAIGEGMLTDTRVRRGVTAPPNFGTKVTLGYGTQYANGGRIGFFASASYKNQHATLRETIRSFGIGDGELNTETPRVAYQGTKTTYNVAWSSVGALKWRANKRHRFALLGMYSRDSDDETRELVGTVPSIDAAPVINTRQRYTMRSVALTRLGGKHRFPRAHDLRLDWFGSYAQARRDDPSIRDMLFTQGAEGTPGLDPTSGGGKLLFLRLEDHTESGAANLALPFDQWRQLGSRFKTGIWAEGKQREFNARRFAYTGNGLELPNGTGDVLTPDSIGGGSPNDSQPFFITEGTQPQDNYRASQRLYAAYAMLELPIARWFKIAGGARFEASEIRVDPFDPFDSGANLDSAGVTDRDVLPAATLIFSPRSDMNIRLGGTRTLARPEFRELAKFEFTDFVGAFSVIGNPDLVSTKVWNADARWEWFPSASEVVAASVFYKLFDKPIERVVFARSSGLASFSNAEQAHNVGFELEFRKSLEFVAKALAPFSVGANFAYIHSQVRLSDATCDVTDEDCESTLNVSTESRRPLQGQSPFVVNTYIDFTNTHGTNLRVLYNSFGRRIDQVSGLGLPDIYEEPRHLVDLVFGQEVYRGMTLSLSVDNALNWPRRFTQGGGRTTTYRVLLGTSLKLGLGYKF